MAILFCRAQVIKRSEGRSAVACAAYRCGMVLEDARTGQTHDYSRKQGVLGQGILAPDGSPDWVRDPRQLWNRVEAAETRKDAQLARELVIALPHEIEGAHRDYLIKNILRPWVRDGAVAHYVLHAPSREGDERNIHAHVMLTLRRLTPEGEFSATKAREWNDKSALQALKQTIERETNRMLERLGHDQRVSVDLAEGQQPTRHLGRKASWLERKGIKTERGEENRAIQEGNDRRVTMHRWKEQTERAIEEEEARLKSEREAETQRRDAAARQRQQARESSPTASWWQAMSARAALHTQSPSNENQQNQPEPPRRRTAQRETFNTSARPQDSPPPRPASIEDTHTPTADFWKADRLKRAEQEEAQRQTEARRKGDGGDSQTQTNTPANENKRRPRAKTAEEMRARRSRGGRERTREPDRD